MLVYSDGKVIIWDTNTMEVCRVLEGHTGPVLSCGVDETGTQIVSAGASLLSVRKGKRALTKGIGNDCWSRVHTCNNGLRLLIERHRTRVFIDFGVKRYGCLWSQNAAHEACSLHQFCDLGHGQGLHHPHQVHHEPNVWEDLTFGKTRLRISEPAQFMLHITCSNSVTTGKGCTICIKCIMSLTFAKTLTFNFLKDQTRNFRVRSFYWM